MGTTLIRPAEEGDIEAIVRIWREGAFYALRGSVCSLPEGRLRDFFLERIRAVEPPFGFWVACADDGTVIGWQALAPFDNNPVTRSLVAEWSIYVARSHTRQGVGEALTRYAMKFASEGSLQYVIGFISSENIEALALTQRCGWTRVGALPHSEKEPARPEVIIAVFAPGPQDFLESGGEANEPGPGEASSADAGGSPA